MKRYLAAAAAALFLGTGLLLNGCQAIPEDILPSLSRPASAENSQTLFEELTGDIFRENAASSILDRHYLMAEPENFNLPNQKASTAMLTWKAFRKAPTPSPAIWTG